MRVMVEICKQMASADLIEKLLLTLLSIYSKLRCGYLSLGTKSSFSYQYLF